MAKKKYNWNTIRAEYELGKSNAYLHKKYEVPYNTLSMKIKRDKWETVNDEITALREFKQGCEHVSEVIEKNVNNTSKLEVIREEIDTIAEDVALIGNNRKLLKGFQGLIAKNLKEGGFKTAQDIRAGVGSIKDIEAVANPRTNDTKVEINNANVQQTAIQIEWD